MFAQDMSSASDNDIIYRPTLSAIVVIDWLRLLAGEPRV
jgi:hypothetical protein